MLMDPAKPCRNHREQNAQMLGNFGCITR